MDHQRSASALTAGHRDGTKLWHNPRTSKINSGGRPGSSSFLSMGPCRTEVRPCAGGAGQNSTTAILFFAHPAMKSNDAKFPFAAKESHKDPPILKEWEALLPFRCPVDDPHRRSPHATLISCLSDSSLDAALHLLVHTLVPKVYKVLQTASIIEIHPLNSGGRFRRRRVCRHAH